MVERIRELSNQISLCDNRDWTNHVFGLVIVKVKNQILPTAPSWNQYWYQVVCVTFHIATFMVFIWELCCGIDSLKQSQTSVFGTTGNNRFRILEAQAIPQLALNDKFHYNNSDPKSYKFMHYMVDQDLPVFCPSASAQP